VFGFSGGELLEDAFDGLADGGVGELFEDGAGGEIWILESVCMRMSVCCVQFQWVWVGEALGVKGYVECVCVYGSDRKNATDNTYRTEPPRTSPAPPAPFRVG
jgi:hypothetical protein